MGQVEDTAGPNQRKSLVPVIGMGLLLFLAGVAIGQVWQGRSSRADEPRLLDLISPPKPISESEIGAEQIEGFKNWYYVHQATTFSNTYWQGVRIVKCPLDAWIFQEIIHENPPDVLIETGTADGGGAYFFASLFDLEKRGRVLTVDITDNPGTPRHHRIRYILGSSTSPEVFQTFKNSIRPGERVMVSLDSDHHKHHVLEELRLYSSLVTVGDYLVVEDSIKNPNYPGAMEAVEEFLKNNSNYVADKSREKFGFTANPNGWLKRIR
jgi:cephalosporin hydroxylase